MPEVGERYLGTVVKTTTFGAFVSLLPGKDGLLHISQLRKLAGGKRVENVEDVVKVGDKVQVEIAEIDQRGKLSLIPVIESRRRGRRCRRPTRPPVGRLRRRPKGVSAHSTDRPRSASGLDDAPCSRGRTAPVLVRRTVLPGGLRIVTEAMPTVRSATFGIWVGRRLARRGTRRSPAPSHYLEHLLFKGTAAPHRAGHLRRRSTRSAAR